MEFIGLLLVVILLFLGIKYWPITFTIIAIILVTIFLIFNQKKSAAQEEKRQREIEDKKRAQENEENRIAEETRRLDEQKAKELKRSERRIYRSQERPRNPYTHLMFEYSVVFLDTDAPNEQEQEVIDRLKDQGYEEVTYGRKYDGITFKVGIIAKSDIVHQEVASPEFEWWLNDRYKNSARQNAEFCIILVY